MRKGLKMKKITHNNGKGDFEFLFLKKSNPTFTAIFSAGGGGNPERHLPLLQSLAESGCTVVAPYFERLVSPIPSAQELYLRVTTLETALDLATDSKLPIVGIGHSIGATLLLSLAGARMWLNADTCLSIDRNEHLKKLVLFSPPTGFFQAANSLINIQIPLQVWGGTLDTITPPQQLEVFHRGLPNQAQVDIKLIEGAGHFNFMNVLPPNIVDPIKKRDEFLTQLSSEVCKFVVS